MLKNNKLLSIIIVVYNDTDYLKRCVASVYQKLAGFSSWEIIIVNNDKNQNIKQLPLDFSKIKLVDHKKNVGFGAGVNLGVKEASGKFLLLLNPDAELLTNNISEVINEFEKNNEIGIIGGRMLDEKKENHNWNAGQEMSFYNLIKNNLGLSKQTKSKKIKCDWVTGTVFFIRKELFQQLGGFDENFFMYFEDMDLCKRARQTGWKVIFFPAFTVFHAGGKSYSNKKLQKKHYYNSLEYYFKKHCHWTSRFMIGMARKLLRK